MLGSPGKDVYSDRIRSQRRIQAKGMKPLNRMLQATLAIGAAAVLLTSCSDTEGTPSPATTTGATTTTGNGSPAGGTELDIAKYVDAPCDILKPDQVAVLGTFEEPEAGQSVSGPSCTYTGADVLKDSSYEIVFVTNGSTYEEIVENSKAKPIHSESTISGIPIASSDGTDGLRNCTTAIRTSDKDAVLVQISVAKNDAKNNGQACTSAEKLTETVIANLKG
ncbi:DUF3558 domain-containing protein [Saccharothrix coeruleofusca]|uniref:DUF3558 domain-containing protein n=1 Tax=Saccharothrix coeruleofusca TaxID=33919 RepID=UPI00167000E0|nr:DUF3558 domain-containing protein [Saccharothrix coeruleofusca]